MKAKASAPTCTNLFVYGTMLPGQPNNGRLGDSEFLGYDHVVGFALFNRGFTCAVGPGSINSTVKGAIYRVTFDLLVKTIDRAEGTPHVYRRRGALTEKGSRVYIYEWSDWDWDPLRNRIHSGDWAKHVTANKEEFEYHRAVRYSRKRFPAYQQSLVPQKLPQKKRLELEAGVYDSVTEEWHSWESWTKDRAYTGWDDAKFDESSTW